MAATINDVARRAGVAKKTVSRVINNEPHVRPAMKAKVETAIAELGFVPNIGAQRLATNRTFTIGFVIGADIPDLLASALASATRVAMAEGYTVTLVPFDRRDPASPARIARLAQSKQADGLIIGGPLGEALTEVASLLPSSFPWVHIGSRGTPAGVPSVSTDDIAGARAMTEYLLEVGHRRFGHVGAYMNGPLKDRRQGFEAALGDHGVSVDSRYMVVVDDLSFESGLQAGQTLMALHPRPTAICAVSDALAAGVIAAARDVGSRLPQDLSVTGFDDFALAQQMRPSLTTVRVPMDEMSRAASHLLIELIRGRAPSLLHVQVPLSLVVRQSTGPCRET